MMKLSTFLKYESTRLGLPRGSVGRPKKPKTKIKAPTLKQKKRMARNYAIIFQLKHGLPIKAVAYNFGLTQVTIGRLWNEHNNAIHPVL